MESVKWKKPTAETIARFERVAPGPPLEARSMFGMPCRFLNGHMLVGVFQDVIMLRLDERNREECIAAGARAFRPMGREMKGYVEITADSFDDWTLKQWIARGMRFVGTLPPKVRGDSAEARRASARPAAKDKRRKAATATTEQTRAAARPKSETKKPPLARRAGKNPRRSSQRRADLRVPRHRSPRRAAAS